MKKEENSNYMDYDLNKDYHETNPSNKRAGLEPGSSQLHVWCPGARFSKVPVTSGPDNLSGPLSGNFIGPDVAFLEAPVNFPGNFRAR